MKSYDAIIAGAGLIGSAIALELARNDLRVALFDAREPGGEASWASAGILSPAPENPGMISMVPIGKASLALYSEFIAQVEGERAVLIEEELVTERDVRGVLQHVGGLLDMRLAPPAPVSAQSLDEHR